MILPKNWISVNIPNVSGDDQLIFLNHKRNLISIHPPYSMKKIDLFKVI